jgi:16S rRNA (cytidine1402-2'-O)-methyltransferase
MVQKAKAKRQKAENGTEQPRASHFCLLRSLYGMPGTLFVVATPIGNLEDLSFRALRTLREVDLVAAEDTRRTLKLLNHYEVRKPLVSLREHNEARESGRLVQRLLRGENVALVSDAGTPAVADPGARLVQQARNANVPVVPIPGPSAVTAAISAAGFPADQFVFMGFPPPRGGDRRRWLESLAREPRLTAFFEAPHRITKTMAEVAAACGDRPIIVYSELTKIHEKSVVYPITPSYADPKGEFTVVVGPWERDSAEAKTTLESKVQALMAVTGMSLSPEDEDRIVSLAANLLGEDQQLIRKTVKKHKILVKQHTWPPA